MAIPPLMLAAMLAASSVPGAQRDPAPSPVCLVSAERPSSAPDSAVKRNRLALWVPPFGLGLDYSRRTQPGRLYGAGVGLENGSPLVAIISSRAFAQTFWRTGRDWPAERGFLEFAHLELFRRYEPAQRWRVDWGIRLSVWTPRDGGFLTPMPRFVGVYVAPEFHWWWIWFGSRLMVGRFSVGGTYHRRRVDDAAAIVVVPVAARLELARAW